MKPPLFLAALLLVALAPSVSAQPRLYVGLSGGYSIGQGPGGPSLDGSIGLCWGRLLVNAHVVELTYQEGFVSPLGSRPDRVDYRAGLDLGYALPVGRSLALAAGAGTRVARLERVAEAGEDYRSFYPFLYGGVLWGRPDALNVFARVEVQGNLVDQQLGQLQVGVAVPLIRLGRGD